MDVLEELDLTNLADVLAISNTISDDLKQHLIDHSMVECTIINDRPYYFGKKWTPPGYGWKSGGCVREYRNGKKTYSRFLTVVAFDNVMYADFNGFHTLWKLISKKLEVLIYGGGNISISIPVKQTFDSIPLDRIEIHEEGVNYEFKDNEYISNDDYVYPHIARLEELQTYPANHDENCRGYCICKFDVKKLEHNNPQVIWEFGDYYPSTEAGYLPKRTRARYIPTYTETTGELMPITEMKERDYQTIKDIPAPSNVEEIADQILEILPPISAETALYNPKAYIECMPRITELLEKYIV